VERRSARAEVMCTQGLLSLLSTRYTNSVAGRVLLSYMQPSPLMYTVSNEFALHLALITATHVPLCQHNSHL